MTVTGAAVMLGTLAYLAVLAVRMTEVVRQVGWDSDGIASAGVITDGLRAPAHGTAYLGNHAEYGGLLLNLVLAPLPGHHRLWEAWPLVIAALTVALLVATSHRLAGWWGAVTTAALSAVASPALLEAYSEQLYRGETLLTTVLLSLILLSACRRRDRASRRLIAAIAAVGLLTAIGVASDPLLLASGVAPLVAVCALLVILGRGRRAGLHKPTMAILATTATATVAGILGGALAARLGYRPAPISTHVLPLAGPRHWGRNVGLLAEGVGHLAGGTTIAEPFSASSAAAVLASVLGMLAAVVVLQPLRAPLRAVKAGRLHARAALEDAVANTRSIYMLFWTLSAVAVAASFVASGLATDVKAVRYLVPLPLAAAALVPLWAAGRDRRRVVAAALVAIFTATAAYQLQRTVDGEGFSLQPYARGQEQLLALLRNHGLHHGYAPYFDANVLTWNSDGAVAVRAVDGTAPACHDSLCPYLLNTLGSWYAGDVAGPSFLVVDPLQPEVKGPPPAWGTPVAVYRTGRFTVLVYPYDVAARLAGRPA